MINHARTLLLNYPGPKVDSLYIPADVYIPDYRSVVLPSTLAGVHKFLFGTMPDYEGMVYRAAQYIPVLHATPYGHYMTDLDSRLTYDPGALTTIREATYGTTVETNSVTQMSIAGIWRGITYSGRVNTMWLVTALTSDSVNVVNVTEGITAVFNNIFTTHNNLPGSDLVFSFSGSALVPGNTWTVKNKSTLSPDFATIISGVTSFSPAVLAYLFTRTSDITLMKNRSMPEPFLTFYNLFTDNYSQMYKAVGFLLALIYRVEEIRVCQLPTVKTVGL
jgi:hypothetical protein